MKIINKILALIVLVAVSSSCVKNYIPENRVSLAQDMIFTSTRFSPVLGRNSVISSNFSVGNSSQPLNFKITKIKSYDGSSSSELTNTYPVVVWKEPYTGLETSIDEIKNKQQVQNRQLFEVYPHAGVFAMWGISKSTFVKSYPDSCYFFDVEVSSEGGGSSIFRNLQLMPYKERPFEPSNQDAVTGLTSSPYVGPSQFNNVYGDSTNRQMGGGDMHIFFFKNNSSSSKLSFKFFDNKFNIIPVDSFNLTNWPVLLHGFNMTKTRDSVSYDVLYPIPLVERKTNYTTVDGTRAHVEFSYSRIGFAGITVVAAFGLNFSIYEQGNWTIAFQFSGENPKFSND